MHLVKHEQALDEVGNTERAIYALFSTPFFYLSVRAAIVKRDLVAARRCAERYVRRQGLILDGLQIYVALVNGAAEATFNVARVLPLAGQS